MNAFLTIVASNAVVAVALAVAAGWLGRSGRNAAVAHAAWVVVLLKLGTPPLVTAGLPVGFVSPAAAPAPTPPPAPAVAAADPPRAGPSAAPAPPGAAVGFVSPTTGAAPRATPVPVPAARHWSPAALLVAVWAVGSCGVGAVAAVRIARFARGLRDAAPAPAEVRAEVADLAARLGLRRVPAVVLTARAVPPLVWSCGLAPRLVLPAALLDRLDPDARRSVLAHELAHVRRGDHRVRLLELAATTLFWWHPVAWLAGRRLRELEDECCDGRALALLPGRPRAYARALVDTLDFLAGRECFPVPLRTAIGSPRTLSRRITMLARPRRARLSARGLALVVALAAGPLALAVAAPRQEPPARPVAPQQPPVAPPVAVAGAGMAVLKGRVTDKKGAPLPGVRVVAAVPGTDMRFVNLHSGRVLEVALLRAAPEFALVEARSDAGGNYRLEVPGLAEPTKAAVDALAPGYRRLVGTLMRGGDPNDFTLEAGKEVEANLALEPASYYAGTVVDEGGRPIAGVQINALGSFPRNNASGGIECTASGPDGSFELFSYPIGAVKMGDEAGKGLVFFAHPDYVAAQIDDVYAIDGAEREQHLRVVLPTGYKVAGTVVDDAGKPVAGALVKARPALLGPGGKGATTDAEGRFALRGLTRGLTALDVRAIPIRQKFRLPALLLDADKADVAIKLRPIVLPPDLKTYDVLGMRLADVTPEVQAAYDLYHPRGR